MRFELDPEVSRHVRGLVRAISSTADPREQFALTCAAVSSLVCLQEDEGVEMLFAAVREFRKSPEFQQAMNGPPQSKA